LVNLVAFSKTSETAEEKSSHLAWSGLQEVVL